MSIHSPCRGQLSLAQLRPAPITWVTSDPGSYQSILVSTMDLFFLSRAWVMSYRSINASLNWHHTIHRPKVTPCPRGAKTTPHSDAKCLDHNPFSFLRLSGWGTWKHYFWENANCTRFRGILGSCESADVDTEESWHPQGQALFQSGSILFLTTCGQVWLSWWKTTE